MKHAMTVLINHDQLATLVEMSDDKTENIRLSSGINQLTFTVEGLADSLICINNSLGENVLIGSVLDIRYIVQRLG